MCNWCKSRDDFPEKVKRILHERAAHRCSNPGCCRQTIFPHTDPDKSVGTGVAAHICAAALNGPRYDPTQSKDDRSSAMNGIWLCHACSDRIDKDQAAFPVSMLRKWKREHDAWVASGAIVPPFPVVRLETMCGLLLSHGTKTTITGPMAASFRDHRIEVSTASRHEIRDLRLLVQFPESVLETKCIDHPAGVTVEVHPEWPMAVAHVVGAGSLEQFDDPHPTCLFRVDIGRLGPNRPVILAFRTAPGIADQLLRKTLETIGSPGDLCFFFHGSFQYLDNEELCERQFVYPIREVGERAYTTGPVENPGEHARFEGLFHAQPTRLSGGSVEVSAPSCQTGLGTIMSEIVRLIEGGQLRDAGECFAEFQERRLSAGREELASDLDLGTACCQMAVALSKAGRTKQALSLSERARTHFQKADGLDPGRANTQMGWCLVFEGRCLLDLKQLDEATAAFEQAMTYSSKAADRRGIAIAKSQLGSVALQKGRPQEALTAMKDAMSYFESSADNGDIAVSELRMGMAYEANKEPKKAEESFQKALEINTQLGNMNGKSSAMSRLGLLYAVALGRPEDGISMLRQAADSFAEQRDRRKERSTRANLGTVLCQTRRLAEAREQIRRAIECTDEADDAPEASRLWAILAMIEIESGNLPAAQLAIDRAKRIRTESSSP